MTHANRMLIDVLLRDILTPEIVEEAVDAALEALLATDRLPRERRLLTDLTQLEEECRRLAVAFAAGGQMSSLIEALQKREAERERLRTAIAMKESDTRPNHVDRARLRNEL